MSITDELRECIRTANRSYEDARNPYNDREILHIPEEELLAIADRIDERHERGMVLDESGWMVSTRELRGYGVLPAALRHVQPDSWVRIIGDAMSFEGDGWYSTRDDAMAELVERCRRLAHDGR